MKFSSVAYGLVAIVTALAWPSPAPADPFNVGPEACHDCHKPEFEVWEKTKHAESFKEFHRDQKTRDVLKATGERSPKTSTVCLNCHYTTAQKDAAAKPDQVAGPSCESCHGPGSDYIKIHNDYGGPGVKKEAEAPAHKAKRLANSVKAGMRLPETKFEIAENCFTCHALGRKEVDGAVLGKMIDNGHPVNADFEFLRFSQGSLRHRFYPPDTTVNKELSPTEKAEAYAVGQAAALVIASQSLSKSSNAKFVEAEKARIAKAKEVLGKIPEAQKLVSAPTEENGRAFAAAIHGKDLTKSVGPLPDPASYK